ncbi:hypothetical protein FQR65_LT06151 [Abscondita terminalis]|nr:hypothetical protein FQR65_LT06151 [Abscondita terminalis]
MDILEDNAFHSSEDIIAELQDRKSRLNNIMVYNLPDSVNAEASDQQSDLFDKCNKFHEKTIRPLKITRPSKEDVHWIFQNKKTRCKDINIAISADLTQQQRAYRLKVVEELKSRLDKGKKGNIHQIYQRCSQHCSGQVSEKEKQCWSYTSIG